AVDERQLGRGGDEIDGAHAARRRRRQRIRALELCARAFRRCARRRIATRRDGRDGEQHASTHQQSPTTAADRLALPDLTGTSEAAAMVPTDDWSFNVFTAPGTQPNSRSNISDADVPAGTIHRWHLVCFGMGVRLAL